MKIFFERDTWGLAQRQALVTRQDFLYGSAADAILGTFLGGLGAFDSISQSRIISKEDRTFRSVIEKLEKIGYTVNCESKESLSIVLISSEKKTVFSDLFILSIGIIPGKCYKSIEMYGFTSLERKPEYYSVNKGVVWASVFLLLSFSYIVIRMK